MTEVLAPSLPVPLGDDFDRFDSKVIPQLSSRPDNDVPETPSSPRVAHVYHSHFLLSLDECTTINAWFLDNRFKCEEILESFHDTRDGVFWKTGIRWLKHESVVSASDRPPTPQEKAGFWTLKWEASRESDVEYKEISQRKHPNNPERCLQSIVEKLRDDFHLKPVVKSSVTSPLVYLPVNICSYVTRRYTPVRPKGPRWWVDCAQISNPRTVGKPCFYTILTVEVRYGGADNNPSIGGDSSEDEEVVRMKEKGPSAYSKVIVALALRDKQVPLSSGSLTYEKAIQLCTKDSVLARHFDK